MGPIVSVKSHTDRLIELTSPRTHRDLYLSAIAHIQNNFVEDK